MQNGSREILGWIHETKESAEVAKPDGSGRDIDRVKLHGNKLKQWSSDDGARPFFRSQEFQAGIREHRRRARQAVNDAVQESTELYEAEMLQ